MRKMLTEYEPTDALSSVDRNDVASVQRTEALVAAVGRLFAV